MRFTILDGQAVPVPAMAGDDDKTFTLQETAARLGRTSQQLEQLWRATFGWMLQPDDPSTIATAPEIVAQEKQPGALLTAGLTMHRLQLVRMIDYPELSNEEFQFVVEHCRIRGLNLLTRQVKPVIRVENGRRRIEIITTVGAFRLIGQRNGCREETAPQWSGRDGQWKELWTDEAPPFAARAAVTKPGETKPTWGIAYWDACVQFAVDEKGKAVFDDKGTPLPSDFWMGARGAHQLGKCAIAAAYRAACPDDLGSIYTFDEMMQMNNPRPQRPEFANVSVRAIGEVDPDDDIEATPADDVLVDDATPATEQSFQRELLELNFNTKASRDMLVRQMEAKFPRVRSTNPRRFYALVLHTVRPNPQVYGAEPDEVLVSA